MAEVSNRVNFGSWTGRLTCPVKSGQREYPMISGLVRKKKVWNSVSGKYRTGLHLMMLNEHIHLHFVVRLCGVIPRNRDITSWGSIPKSLEWHSLILIKMVCKAPVQCNLKKHSAIYFEKTWMRKWGITISGNWPKWRWWMSDTIRYLPASGRSVWITNVLI